MKIGLATAKFPDLKLDEICKMISRLGYEAVELPANRGNQHLDIDKAIMPSESKRIRELVSSYGLLISALSNHVEGQLILGPYGTDTDSIYKDTKEEKIQYGIDRMIKTAQAANALEVPVVVGFVGCENFGRFFPFPYFDGWAEMENDFIERFGKVLDRYKEYGIKFANEPFFNQFVYDIDTAVRSVELMGNRKEWGFNFDPGNLIHLGVHVETFIKVLKDRIYYVHAKDGEMVAHNISLAGCVPKGNGNPLDAGFRFRNPGWGDVSWKKVLSELALVGYDYVLSYEYEDEIMSEKDGIKKAIEFLKPLLLQK